MTSLPVIVRELRAEARRPFNYWLRAIGAGALLAQALLAWLLLYVRLRRVVSSGLKP